MKRTRMTLLLMLFSTGAGAAAVDVVAAFALAIFSPSENPPRCESDINVYDLLQENQKNVRFALPISTAENENGCEHIQ